MEAFSVRTSRLLLSLMFGFVVLGLAAGVLNVYRVMQIASRK